MIVLAATPIGNLTDTSTRLRDALATASVIASEDTRVTHRLIAGLGITNRPRLIALHEHNERQLSAEIVGLAHDSDVLVLSDAGMPTVSDPGFQLVKAAVDAGVAVTAIPGPSAVITALAVSGMPTDRFAFEGFLPRKTGDRSRRLTELAGDRRTLVFFEAPSRLATTLAAMAESFGTERMAAVCRELTKLHEEVQRGKLSDLVTWASAGVRGEICIVVHGAAEPVADFNTAQDTVVALAENGTGLKDAAAQVAAETGLSKRALYEAVLRHRRG